VTLGAVEPFLACVGVVSATCGGEEGWRGGVVGERDVQQAERMATWAFRTCLLDAY
jgi:hypothetical protein